MLLEWLLAVFKVVSAVCLAVYLTTRNWKQPDDDYDSED